MDWGNKETPVVDDVDHQLWQFEEDASSSLVTAVEKLSQEFQQFKEDTSYPQYVQTSISAVKIKCAPAQ